MEFPIDQAAPHLRYLVARSGERMRHATNLQEPYAPGKWTRQQLLGHLIDSAANNHQRITRALYQPSVALPGYEQEEMVRVQRYAEAPAESLIHLWTAYNTHLAWVIEGIAADRLATPVQVGVDAPLPLERLVLDYIAHLEHHLRQLLGAQALLWSGLPWGMTNDMMGEIS